VNTTAPSTSRPGYRAVTDQSAESAVEGMPAFLAPPPGSPAYHGFPLLKGAEIDGWSFGVITSPQGTEPAVWGDAYVVAPDGSRAGIVWQASGEAQRVVCEPSEGRWGVYGFRFSHPVRNEQDLIRNLHECLPQLKAYYRSVHKPVANDNPTGSSDVQPIVGNALKDE
jgi:hypothetical protein